MTRTYTCEACGGTFEDGRPEEEAHAESVRLFGRRGDDPSMAIVCEECFRRLVPEAAGGAR